MPQMEAEILFLNPNDVNAGVATLEEHDFAVETLDWIDPCGPTVWIKAQITTDMADVDFLHWVAGLVGPLGGDVVEAGLLIRRQPLLHKWRLVKTE